ncbi:FAD/NAD(P)-binding protein [Saccharothrix violaceirubra]|uniref:Putative NAD(P)/FAD-binding protein YdhS n=1 Tax=Saccharothrix violaceirubra TaxID=413306 RepID=A0A7W7WUE6_9PSEU|nr:FAD/NAD(P)-binding domain-containing protein [Saccharothrix violaceirubra]MBB4963303.1 putative NAD(P)/FAD-binding protein YdhS [Saccharothrix violaceirubra]
MTVPVVVLAGGGPRAAGLLERLGANASVFGGPLEVHVVDPFPAGAGRVWRHEQSGLLRMNSMAEDVTVFTDDSVVCEGPIVPGPSLAEWAAGPALSEVDLDSEVRAELLALTPRSFPSRRVQSAYLKWFLGVAAASLPEGSVVRVHPHRVVGLDGDSAERQRVRLDGVDEPIVADVVVLTLGHLDNEIDPEHAALAAYAAEHGLTYLPPDYTADTDLSAVPAGEDIVVRGMGLAFVDLFVLLAEGRGGVFERVDGTLVYRPSGREPRLHVGSRRGVPYHSKTGYKLQGVPPEPPKFFHAEEILALPGDLQFRSQLWPSMARDIAYSYYRELFTGHPSRVTTDWETFSARFGELDWYSDGMRELVARSVPADEDRLDFERLDRPIAGVVFDDSAALQEYLRGYVEADVARRSDTAYSADLGAFFGLLGVYGQLPGVLASGRLRGDNGWWHGFFSYQASGPPPERLEELLALSRAGIVTFLGADVWVRAEDGVFLAGGASVPGHVVRARGLIEARLPEHSLDRTADPLLRSLRDAGEVFDAEGQVRVAADDCRVLDASGVPHARRFAIGPYTNNKAYAAFARPRTNAPAFRQNDLVARAVLKFLS